MTRKKGGGRLRCPACEHILIRKGDELVHSFCGCECDGTENENAANPDAAARLRARVAEADACLERLGVTWNGHAYIGMAREREED